MSKFKQKSPIVEAIAWEGDNEKEVKAFMPPGAPPPLFTRDGDVDIWTAVGIVRAKPNAFIIKDAEGDLGVMGAEGFVRAYEVVPETDGDGRARYFDAEKRRAALEKQQQEGHHGQA